MIDDYAKAVAERNAGMQRATDHAEADHPNWGVLALDYLKAYAATHERFPGWFVTKAASLSKAVPEASGKAWGSIFTKAARQGWIVRDGFDKDPNRHMNPCPVWRSMCYRGQA